MNEKKFITDLTIFDVAVQHSASYEPELNPDYAVKGLLNIGEVSVLFGPPGLGKTAIVAAICAHASLGRDFADRLTRETCVIYFAAEDAVGVHNRAHPYLGAQDFRGAPFYVIPKGFDLTSKKAVDEAIVFIRKVMARHGLSQSLVVFDTLNKMLGVSDENSSTVVGAVMSGADRIAAEVNAAALIIHHSGKGNSSTPRGSSAIHGNADNLSMLTQSKDDDKLVFWQGIKAKSSPELCNLGFRITPHGVGIDNDGVSVSVAKAVPQGTSGFTVKTAANDNIKPNPKSGVRKEDVARVLNDQHLLDTNVLLSPSEIADRTGTAFRAVRDNRDSLLKAVRRSLAQLVSEGRVDCSEGRFVIRPDASARQD